MQEEEKLPFDIRTLLIGIWLRKWIIVIGVLLSILLGLLMVKFFGKRLYSAETVLVYQPIMKEQESDTSQALNTFLHLVKVQSNLEETRKRLKLPVSTARLGASISVFLMKNTDLMVIKVNWGHRQQTAQIANTIRDVFMENNQKMRSGKWYLSELAEVDSLYQETLLKKKAFDKQEANLDRIINDLKNRIKKEKIASKELEGLGNINIRVSQLRATIKEDKINRAKIADLTRKESEMKRAKILLQKNIISKSEFDLVKAEYETQKALTEDTEQTKKWKKELKELNKIILPSGSEASTSTPILSEMMLKVFEIQLEKVSVTEKLSILDKSRSRLTEQLKISRANKKSLNKSKKAVPSVDEIDWAELSAEKRLSILAQSTGFSIISNATAPVYPQKSNRKMIFAAIAFLGSFLSFALAVGLELIDTSVKSEAELKLKFVNPVFGFVPLITSKLNLVPGQEDSEEIEYFRFIARKIRGKTKDKGLRIMIASIDHNAGSTFVAANLAACFGRLDERVLILDAQIRTSDPKNPLSDLIEFNTEHPIGLGEYLSYETDAPEDIIYPTSLPGVMCIPKIGKAIIPDLAGTNRMRELLDELSNRYSIILIDTPPIFPSVDAELIAEAADLVLIVIESKKTKFGQVKRSLERLEREQPNKIGFILNKVSKLYIENV